ncbi:hypothetical protein BpHYR1_032385 [Brachionus plicatilis]|uniref:Uncharacterized protein n=1 Tax=Brachionus plicatilis TaxID=10195 RepID=A0A3M7SH58_BRAPC|nr:hypothetical protein BpHYR1_032385 [Brachionus plicatilis]
MCICCLKRLLLATSLCSLGFLKLSKSFKSFKSKSSSSSEVVELLATRSPLTTLFKLALVGLRLILLYV